MSEAVEHLMQISPVLTANPGEVARLRMQELVEAFRQVIQDGSFILGRHVASFEEEFASWQGSHGAVGVANGTDAVELCLRALKVARGDLVIVPTHTAVATATAVCRAGAIPLLLDINEQTFNLDLDLVEDVLLNSPFRNRIKSVVVVHLYGNPCEMNRVLDLADRFGLSVVEDCSQAHGAWWKEKRVGNFAQAAAFSCYPTKNLGALGDAGICISNSGDVLTQIRLLRQYGWKERYISSEIGMNSRLDEVQAALLSVQLRHLNDDLQARKNVAAHYLQSLAPLPVALPTSVPGGQHAYHQFTIRVSQARRGELLNHLQRSGVGASILYPEPIHRQPAYAELADSMPVDRRTSEEVCASLVCLPMHPLLDATAVGRVCKALHSFPW